MTNTQHNIIHIGMFIGLVILFVVCTFKCCCSKPIENGTETHSDTVFLTSVDTFYITKDSIIYKEKRVLDTIFLTDTFLLKEQKVYEDTFSKIWVSGVEPEIDSIIHFIPRDTVLINTETTTTVVKKKKFGLGITLGVYVGAGGYYDKGKIGLAPEIGVGGVIGPTIIIK